MGNFYTNIVLIGSEPAAALAFLREKKRSAYVLDPATGHVVIFDEKCDSQDLDEIHALGAAVSKQLGCSAIASLNHDDDLLYISAYAGGHLVTEYESRAGRHIHPVRLCRIADVTILRAPFLFLVLVLPRFMFLFELFRHNLLAKLLRLPTVIAGSGYDYIDEGEPPVDPSNKIMAIIHTLDENKPPPPLWER